MKKTSGSLFPHDIPVYLVDSFFNNFPSAAAPWLLSALRHLSAKTRTSLSLSLILFILFFFSLHKPHESE